MAVGALAAPATAAAAGSAVSPADAQYSHGPSVVTGGGQVSTTSQGGSLPFTGFDAGLLAAIGGGLVAAGALIHRRQKARGEQL